MSVPAGGSFEDRAMSDGFGNLEQIIPGFDSGNIFRPTADPNAIGLLTFFKTSEVALPAGGDAGPPFTSQQDPRLLSRLHEYMTPGYIDQFNPMDVDDYNTFGTDEGPYHEHPQIQTSAYFYQSGGVQDQIILVGTTAQGGPSATTEDHGEQPQVTPPTPELDVASYLDWDRMVVDATALSNHALEKDQPAVQHSRALSRASPSHRPPTFTSQVSPLVHYIQLRSDMVTSLPDILSMLTGHLGDVFNVEAQPDPYNEGATDKADTSKQNTAGTPSPLMSPTLPSIDTVLAGEPTVTSQNKGKGRAPLSPLSPPQARSMPRVDAFKFAASPTLVLSPIVIFSCLGPTQVLTYPVISKSIIEFRRFCYRTIMMKPTASFKNSDKAAMIDNAIIAVLSQWCTILLASRVLGGEGLTLAMANKHIDAFGDSTESGLIMGIASQMDITFIPSQKRKQGWRVYFDRKRKVYYERSCVEPMVARCQQWYQDFLTRYINFTLKSLTVARWYSDVSTYWPSGGDVLKLHALLQVRTLSPLHFYARDWKTQEQVFKNSPFDHEFETIHLSSVGTITLLRHLQKSRELCDSSEPGRCVYLRGGPLLAENTHILSTLAGSAKIALLNYCNMRNPYIAASAEETTWHAPVSVFSAAVVSVALGGVVTFGKEVTPIKILQDATLMHSFNLKASTTLEFIKKTLVDVLRPEGVYDIKWAVYYNNKRALQLLMLQHDGAWTSSPALWGSIDPADIGDDDFLNVPLARVKDISGPTPTYNSKFMGRLEKLSAAATTLQQSGSEQKIPWTEGLDKFYTTSQQMADVTLANCLSVPIYEKLFNLSHITEDNIGKEAFAALSKAMAAAALEAAKDIKNSGIPDVPYPNAATPPDLQSVAPGLSTLSSSQLAEPSVFYSDSQPIEPSPQPVGAATATASESSSEDEAASSSAAVGGTSGAAIFRVVDISRCAG